MPPSPKDSSSVPAVSIFLRAVAQTLQTDHMTRPGETVLAAVSGGPDSVALLHALHRLAPHFGIRVAVAHLNHGLRRAAEKDARMVRQLARSLALPCFASSADVRAHAAEARLSLETAGRRLRYAYLQAVATEHHCARIALGHHSDDNAEQVLLNLIRGSGPLGLAAIPPTRGEQIIRPLIRVDRRQIVAFLEAIGAPFVEDASNRDRRFLRNRVRHELIPLLASRFNPAISQTLNRTAEISRADERWLAAETDILYDRMARPLDDGRIALDTPLLNQAPTAARRRLVRRAVAAVRGDLHRFGLEHIDAACALLASTATGKQVHLPDAVTVTRNTGALIVARRPQGPGRVKPRPATVRPYRHELDGPGSVDIPEIIARLTAEVMVPQDAPGALNAGQWSAFFDMKTVVFPLVVRNRHPGDRFRPLGAPGARKVSKFLIDCKIPRSQRERCPIVESDRTIIWVAGGRIAESVKVRSDTRRVLKLTLQLADIPEMVML